MTTQNKSAQASQALIAAGQQPTPELVNAVLEEKSKDNRVSFATATRRVLTAQTSSGQTQGNRVSDSGQSAGVSDAQIKATKQALAQKLKQEIVSDAFTIALTEILAGDLGDMGSNPFLGEDGALDVDFSEVFDQPKFKALSSATPNNSLRLLPSNTSESLDENNI